MAKRHSELEYNKTITLLSSSQQSPKDVTSDDAIVVVVVDYPTPSEGWGHGGKPWSPRSRATPQGLDQRS